MRRLVDELKPCHQGHMAASLSFFANTFSDFRDGK